MLSISAQYIYSEAIVKNTNLTWRAVVAELVRVSGLSCLSGADLLTKPRDASS